MAALVLTVTVYSLASAFALDGVPDTETAVFLVLARVAGLAVIASAVAVARTRSRLARSRPPA